MDPTFWLLVLATIMIFSSTWSARSDLERRIKRIDRKLDLIFEHLGIETNPGVDRQVLDLMKSGQKIAAIKLHRELTGVGLKEAKDYVESL